MSQDKNLQAYVIGLAIGDGNLSKFPRTTRLRISCDNKYPNLMDRISKSLQELFPRNKVTRTNRPRNCTDIGCYSNHLEELCGWSAAGGSKMYQRVRVPIWIKNDPEYIRHCLRGLLETDGSVYKDRGYTMVNFVTAIEGLATDMMGMMQLIGFKPNIQANHSHDKNKYTIRISKQTQEFIDLIGLCKN